MRAHILRVPESPEAAAIHDGRIRRTAAPAPVRQTVGPGPDRRRLTLGVPGWRVARSDGAVAAVAQSVSGHCRHLGRRYCRRRVGRRSSSVAPRRPGLERVWANFHSDQVFHVDPVHMLRAGMHWVLALVSGGVVLTPPKSMLDNSPLRELLGVHVDCAGIRRSIARGHLRAFAFARRVMSRAIRLLSTMASTLSRTGPGSSGWGGARR